MAIIYISFLSPSSLSCSATQSFSPGCWRRLFRVPWTARRSNQSILKEISPGCSFEGRMLKLKLQYFGHLMQRTDSFENTLMLGKIKGRRRRGLQRVRWLDSFTDSMDMSLSALGVGDGQVGLACCDSWGHKELDTTERLNWTELSRITYTQVHLTLCPCFGPLYSIDRAVLEGPLGIHIDSHKAWLPL